MRFTSSPRLFRLSESEFEGLGRPAGVRDNFVFFTSLLFFWHAVFVMVMRGRNDTLVAVKRGGSVVRSLGENTRKARVVGRTDVREWSRHHDESEWSLIISLMFPFCLP